MIFPILLVTIAAVPIGRDIHTAARARSLSGMDVTGRLISAAILLFFSRRIQWTSDMPLWVWYLLALVASASVALAVAKWARLSPASPPTPFPTIAQTAPR